MKRRDLPFKAARLLMNGKPAIVLCCVALFLPWLCETEPVLMFAIQSVPFLQRMLVLYI